jgi:PhzF family phenazine biosynthesis protein
MRIPLYQIDAFAEAPFTGNPAAVMPLESWLPDATLQAIAIENNLSETAFFVAEGDGWHIRWFTPGCEVDLCGHATLASAFVLMTELEPGRTHVRFRSQSGPLEVSREGDLLVLDFPSRPPRQVPIPEGLEAALGVPVVSAWEFRDLVALLDSEEAVRNLDPDMTALMKLDAFAVAVTARGREADFVSRFFVPKEGIPEDPVTGSLHCALVPFWAERLGRTRLQAHQVSRRGGRLDCELRGDRVRIGGRAVKVLEGTFLLS